MFMKKFNWGSAFYSVVADPINFATTNKQFDNNIVTAWQQLWSINWGVRKLPGKIGVRQGSAGSAGVRRGPQNNWTLLVCTILFFVVLVYHIPEATWVKCLCGLTILSQFESIMLQFRCLRFKSYLPKPQTDPDWCLRSLRPLRVS